MVIVTTGLSLPPNQRRQIVPIWFGPRVGNYMDFVFMEIITFKDIYWELGERLGKHRDDWQRQN